jgi:hypothetical protein
MCRTVVAACVVQKRFYLLLARFVPLYCTVLQATTLQAKQCSLGSRRSADDERLLPGTFPGRTNCMWPDRSLKLVI